MSLRKILMLAKKRWLFTNKIRNPRGEGGTVGVIGSGGALPTNWAVEQAMSGVATSFLGAGIAGDGRSYVDIGLAGTLSGANPLIIRMESATYASASAGQAWGLDFGSMLQAGTATGLASVKARIRDSAGVTVADSAENGLSGTATRLQAKGVVSGAATSINPRIVVNSLNNGATVAATIRIYAPKLVQVAAVEGPELVTNGDFASAAGWTTTAGVSIGSGVLTTSSPPQYSLFASTSFTAQPSGSVLKSKIDVVTVTSGDIRQFLGGGSELTGAYISSVGTKTDYVVSTGTQTVYSLQAHVSNVVMSLDNVSLKALTPGYLPSFPILPPVGVPGDSSAWLS